MTYSGKKRWAMTGSALAVGLVGIALALWLGHNHVDPVSVGIVRLAVGLTVVGLAIWGRSYADEVQRQTGQRRWFWGSLIGIAAMLPAVVFLQTHGPWLDATVLFLFRHSATPAFYFSLGVMIPVSFQAASTLVLNLLDKLSRGPQS